MAVPERAWPFLFGRSKNEDYRFVVLPEVTADPALTAALRSAARGDPGRPGTAFVREVQATGEEPCTAVFRVSTARREDYGLPGEGVLADGHGRPIVLTEGLVIRRPASSVLAAGVSQEVLDQVRERVSPAFRQFWEQDAEFSRQIGRAFTVPDNGPGRQALRLERSPACEVPPAAFASAAAAPRPAGDGVRRYWAVAAFVLGIIVLVALIVGVILFHGRVL